MTEREKKLWSWAGKLALVAIPAAISGYASFKKAEVEAKTRSEASYTALRMAFEGQQKDFDELERNVFKLEGRLEMLAAKQGSGQKSAPDGDGIRDAGALRDMTRKLKTRATSAALPAKFDDMVQQYTPKK